MDTVMRKILFPKKALQQPSMKSWNLWIVILNSIKTEKTAREKEYFGALQNRFKKYKEGMEQVLTASSKGDADGATEAINVIQKPSEDYLAKKISSLIAMRKQAMNHSLQVQQAEYEFSRNSAIVFVAVSMLMILFSLWICVKGIVGPMHYISHTLQKMVADIEKIREIFL